MYHVIKRMRLIVYGYIHWHWFVFTILSPFLLINVYPLQLDKHMQYSCAYWKDASTLEKAQENKLHLIARKLKMEPGMKVLEIGCGWGFLACFFAKHYGVHVTGITISNEQLKGARKLAEERGLSDLTSFEYCDYRSAEGQYDRVVSIAMLEAVGYKVRACMCVCVMWWWWCVCVCV